MILVDTHSHLDRYKEPGPIIERAKSAGLRSIITCGIDKETNRKALEIAERYDIVRPALGIYPLDALGEERGAGVIFDIDQEVDFIEKNTSKIIAIGELGLDYYNGKDKERQKKVFQKLLDLAKKINKPLSIHSRKAEKDVVQILESSSLKNSQIILHCFSGKKGLIKKAADYGWNFSIPANIVRAENFQSLVRNVNLSQILTETDSPWLSPFKEKQNEPAFIIETIKEIAKQKGMDIEEVANNIWMNYQRIFL